MHVPCGNWLTSFLYPYSFKFHINISEQCILKEPFENTLDLSVQKKIMLNIYNDTDCKGKDNLTSAEFKDALKMQM